MSRSSTTRSIESGSVTREVRGRQALDVEADARAASRAASRSASMSAAPMAPMHAWYSGMNSWPSSRSNASRSERTAPVVGGHAADEGHRRLDDLALGDGALEVAHHGVAEAAQHLGRLVALLLGVDHVALGEDAAAAGDAGRLAGAEHDVAHVLDVVEQAAGLLVHERAGAGGAVAVGLVVGDAGAADVASVSRRMNLEVSPPISKMVCVSGCSAPMPRVMALNSFSKAASSAGPTRRPPEPVTRAPCTEPSGQHGQQLAEERLGRLGRAALDAPVRGHEHRRVPDERQAVARRLEEVGVLREKVAEEVLVISLADECGLEADAADVDAKRGHGCETGPPRGADRPADCKAYRPRAPGANRARKKTIESSFAVNAAPSRAPRRAPANVTRRRPKVTHGAAS